jgi:hypothetical protein
VLHSSGYSIADIARSGRAEQTAALIGGQADRERAEAAMIFKHKPLCSTQFVDSFPCDTTTIMTSGKNALMHAQFTVTRTTAPVGTSRWPLSDMFGGRQKGQLQQQRARLVPQTAAAHRMKTECLGSVPDHVKHNLIRVRNSLFLV